MLAVILAGGLGSRLGNLTKQVPKPLLPIRGIPFLERYLKLLFKKGFDHVVLAVGYKSEAIKSHFDEMSLIPHIEYSQENELLGTGGAIKKCLDLIDTENFFVINGDSYINVDYKEMFKTHLKNSCSITIASIYKKNASRYGIINFDKKNRVINFKEKGNNKSGYINAGIYLLNKKKVAKFFNKIEKNKFSFEDLILGNQTKEKNMRIYQVDGQFLDIGIPKDYYRSQDILFNE